MPYGFLARRPSLRGHVIRSLLAVLCLSLATSSHASWLGRVFGSSHKAGTAVTTTPTASSTEQTSTAPGSELQGTAREHVTTPEEALSAADAALADAANAEVTEEDSDATVLPNVEESVLGEVDAADDELDIEDLARKGDLWERIRTGFQLDISQDNPQIAVQRNWYLQHPDYLNRVALRGTRYLHYTVTEAERRGLPTELALLPVIESAYDPFAYSHASAAGMWQFIPGTARIMGVKQNWWFDGRRDVLESTRAAYDFLSMLYAKFGDWSLALASYNAGPGAVQRAINRNVAAGLPTDFWSLRLPAETRAYVPRFIAMAQIVKSPQSFGITLRPVVNQPFFRVITTNGQVDMTAAAKIAGVSLKEFYQLNPGFNRAATDPDGPHRLLVPLALPDDFEAQIAALPAPGRMAAETYRVSKGDTIYRVAKRFGITPDELKRLNNLKKNTLPVGRVLTISRASISPEFAALNQEMRLDRMGNGGKASVSRAGKVSPTYKVRRGDTLSTIARRHGVSVKNLARWNGIGTRSPLRAGQRLAIQTSQHTRKPHVASSGKKGDSSVKRISYQVKKGDTLSSISRRYNISVKQIKRWNTSSPRIRTGQGLVLFVADNSSKRSL